MSTLGLGSIAPNMTTTPELTLADVLSRGVVVEWFEAVAVVRATMDELGSGTEQRSTPDLGQVWLTQAGAVRLSGGRYDDQPVRRLGQLLQALLTQADPPVTLKLVVGNATAAVPIYAGLRELDGALAYFERPDRPAVLRGLYARADARQADASHSLRSVDDVAPLPMRSSRKAPTLTRSARRTVTALLIAVVTIGAASLFVRAYREGQRLPVGRITVAAQRVTDRLGGAVLSGISAVTERAGLGRLTPRAEAPASGADSGVKQSSRAGTAHRPALLKGTPTIQAFDLDKQVAMMPVPPVSAVILASGTDGAAADARPAEAVASVDTSLYSTESPDVVPPVAIRPQLPRVLPAGVVAADLSRIEVVVQRDGSVESVKLVAGSRPSTVKDAMLLSAAKAWRFAPATKSGVPVRYRKAIWIIAE